jgi:alpha-tubulin suppressor-like RCC1 family protein
MGPMLPILLAFTIPKEIASICDVRCGKNFTLFVLENGDLYGMGQNHCGQLGIGTLPSGESSTNNPTGKCRLFWSINMCQDEDVLDNSRIWDGWGYLELTTSAL